MQTTVQGYPVRIGGGPYIPRSVQGLQILSQWQQQQPAAPDLWLRSEIAIAFKQFVCMRLGNTPAVEMLPFTAETWAELIGEGMTEQLDRDRIKQGFKQLYRTLKWWPQPAELLNALPRRQKPPQSQKSRTAEEAQTNETVSQEKFQDFMDMLDQKRREENHGA